MNSIATQQVALDNALVAPENRVNIGICNMRINPSKTPKEPTYTGDIDYVTKVYTDHMHQPWRTFAAVINICLSGKTTDFMFQIDNRDSKKQEKMYYPRFTKAIIQHFISKDKSISMRNRLFMHTVEDDSIWGSLRFVSKTEEYQVYGALIPAKMTNRKMLNSTAYKTYLAFATGAATPKKARKFKKPVSPSKKKTLVAIEDPAEKPVKKPAARRQSAGVQIRDTPGMSVSKKAPAKTKRSKGNELMSEATIVEEAEMKKGIKQSKWETTIHQAGGSSEGASLEPEQRDDEQNVSDNPRTCDDEEETQEDEFVHTPENYVPTHDENIDDEEYERINKEMYDDVNVELKDAELVDEGKGDEEMTDAEKVDDENENVNQEVAGDQVNDDAQATVTAALATQKTEISKMARILELKRIHLKIIVLKTNTPYPLRKIRCICACTLQKTMKETRSIRRQFLKELRDNTFSGSDHEDANEHIEKVLEIIDLFHIPNITQDQVMLRAFHMSLTGAASRWLRNKPSGSITTCEDLKIKFLSKYCPPACTAKKMEEINNVQQEPDETLYQAWERFKELLMKCPRQYLMEIQEVILFYNGLNVQTRQILDSKGVIPSKTTADAKVAIQEMAEYS
ncbi:retrovirus-related pol polyprotein from transposon TNT 1-94 [Tanacetum coccineum]